jgi:carboxylesterase
VTDLSFRLAGSGRKGIVLVHGLTGSPVEMKYLARQLNAAGLTVDVPTLAGHATTMDDLRSTTYEDWVETVRLAIRRMAGDADEVYVAGMCAGGMAGLFAGLLEGDTVQGAAVYSPALRLDGWSIARRERLLMRFVPLAAVTPGLRRICLTEHPPYGLKWDRLREILEASGGIEGTTPDFPVVALRQHLRMNRDLLKMLPRARIPLLLVHAAEDDLADLRNAKRIQSRYGGPVELKVLDDSYHMVHVDKQRQAVARWTTDLCSRATPVTEGDAGYDFR